MMYTFVFELLIVNKYIFWYNPLNSAHAIQLSPITQQLPSSRGEVLHVLPLRCLQYIFAYIYLSKRRIKYSLFAPALVFHAQWCPHRWFNDAVIVFISCIMMCRLGADKNRNCCFILTRVSHVWCVYLNTFSQKSFYASEFLKHTHTHNCIKIY